MRSALLAIFVGGLALAALGQHPASAATPTVARGDFDRDGLRDTARVVRGPDGHYRIVVKLGAKARRPVVVYDFGRGRGDFFVASDRPGRYETACHKGYGPDAYEGRPCAHNSVVLKGDVFSFGVAESSEAVALWTGRRFEVVWISD
jgi:hypothetical protein